MILELNSSYFSLQGSTCALTESILRSCGIKTGFFSSPHLIEVTERIQLSGIPISKEKFAKYFWKVYDLLEHSRVHNYISVSKLI